MAHLKTALILLSSALIASSFAFAQDLGTYRPGSPYSAAQASDAAVCSSQCSGDAACRGWNFVRANPRQRNGICEFNSVAVDPIQSPISVSANLTVVNNVTGQNRIIPAGVRTTRIGSPSVNTTRIGAPAVSPAPRTAAAPIQQRQTQQLQRQIAQTQAPQPQAIQKQQNQSGLSIAEQLSPLSQAQPTTSSRRVIRQAVPQQTQAQSASFHHNLGGTPSAIQSPRPQQGTINPAHITRSHNGLPPRAPAGLQQQAKPQQAPQFSGANPRLQQQLLNAQRRGVTQTALHPVSAVPQQAIKPSITQPQAQPQAPQQQVNTPRRGSLIEALTRPDAAKAAQQRPLQQQYPAPTLPPSYGPPPSKNLYGHLNDDVLVPKTLTPEDLSGPADEAIPTVSSVPVIPVERGSFSSLAGG